MSAANLWQYLYLSRFSKPVSDRLLYRVIRQYRPCQLLEIGMGDGQRARRLISVAQRYSPEAEIRYTGIDLFEARPAILEPALSLKEAHRLLKSTGARTHLVPGDPYSALARTANSLGGTQLVVISATHDTSALERAWFYLPRTLAAGAQVFVEQPAPVAGLSVLEQFSSQELERLAAIHTRRKAA